MAYATYQFYEESYHGTAIAAPDFPRLSERASEKIDALTFRRAQDVTDADTLNDLALACCAIAETLQTSEQSGGVDGVQSERVGNHSVTYAAGASMTLTLDEKVEGVARQYLKDTGLMFLGFYRGEYARKR